MRFETLPSRPHDRDLGRVCSEGVLAIHSCRPAHVEGPRHCCHPHHLELSFLERGATYARVGRRDHVLVPGTYSVIPAGVEHRTHTREHGTAGVYMQVEEALFDRTADELGTPRWGRRRTEVRPVPPSLRAILAALRSELDAPEPAPLMVDSLGLYVAGALLRDHAPPGVRDATLIHKLARSVELMRSCPGERPSLDDLAQAAGLSRFRYAHAFRDHYGVSPGRYFTRVRIELAAERLRASSYSVARIADELGFSSPSRLAREFRREMGVAPGEWRRRTT